MSIKEIEQRGIIMDNIRILIVDDNESLNDALKDVLEIRFPDFIIDQAFTGQEALSLSEKNLPDIVVEDIMLPDMNGLEVVKYIRELDADIQVIMITAFGSVESAVEAIHLGAFDFLSKPFKNGQLVRIVEDALRKRMTLLESRKLITKLMQTNRSIKNINNYYKKYFKISSTVEPNFSTPMILSLYDRTLKKRLFGQILDVTLNICDAKEGTCFILSPEQKLHVVASYMEEFVEDLYYSVDEYPSIKKAIERNEVIRSADLHTIYIPMGIETDIFGVCVIKRKDKFLSEDVQLISAIMIGASTVIELNILKEKFYDTNMQTLMLLLNIAGLRDIDLQKHLQRVSSIAGAFARYLNLPDTDAQNIEYAALLHDIGKIGIEDSILYKKGYLSEEERERIKKHPEMGTEAIASFAGMENLKPLIYHHHERYDGTGYPEGLKGKDIPLGSRIIAIVDAYDAITSGRPYRKALSPTDALKELKRTAGKVFDPELTDKFVEYVEKVLLKGGTL